MTCAHYYKNYGFIHVQLDTSQYVRKDISHTIIKLKVIMVTSQLK